MTNTTSHKPQTACPAPPRRHDGTGRALPVLAGVATVAVTVAACSSMSGLTGGGAPSAPADATTAPSNGSFSSRVKSFFSGGSAGLNSAPSDIVCPNVEYRAGAATWAVNVNGQSAAGDNSAMSLRYQASFIQTARECTVTGDNLTIKVGVEGRIVMGPAGSPGTINVPLRYALVREGLHPKTLWTRFYTVPVSVPSADANLPWVHVQEDMTVPRPSPQELEAYVVYVGFDPQGASSPRSKPAGRSKTARAQ